MQVANSALDYAMRPGIGQFGSSEVFPLNSTGPNVSQRDNVNRLETGVDEPFVPLEVAEEAWRKAPHADHEVLKASDGAIAEATFDAREAAVSAAPERMSGKQAVELANAYGVTLVANRRRVCN